MRLDEWAETQRMTTRLRNALSRIQGGAADWRGSPLAPVADVASLCSLTARDLLKVWGFGRESLRELVAMLAESGLSLKHEKGRRTLLIACPHCGDITAQDSANILPEYTCGKCDQPF